MKHHLPLLAAAILLPFLGGCGGAAWNNHERFVSIPQFKNPDNQPDIKSFIVALPPELVGQPDRPSLESIVKGSNVTRSADTSKLAFKREPNGTTRSFELNGTSELLKMHVSSPASGTKTEVFKRYNGGVLHSIQPSR